MTRDRHRAVSRLFWEQIARVASAAVGRFTAGAIFRQPAADAEPEIPEN
jgi:hypothetical protein